VAHPELSVVLGSVEPPLELPFAKTAEVVSNEAFPDPVEGEEVPVATVASLTSELKFHCVSTNASCSSTSSRVVDERIKIPLRHGRGREREGGE
jgi:hypothetical protein